MIRGVKSTRNVKEADHPVPNLIRSLYPTPLNSSGKPKEFVVATDKHTEMLHKAFWIPL